MSHPHHTHWSTMPRLIPMAILTLIFAVVALLPASSLPAQQRKSRKKQATKMEEVNLSTKDGVLLRCSYYAGPESKETVPLIIVHDWDGSRGKWHSLALYLQQQNCSVLVPDLRGHGNSVEVRGMPQPIKREDMRRPAIGATVLDIEAAKSFLIEKNNEGKLNIEQLGVIGAGFGASLALDWAIRDWKTPGLRNFKMGQDVKALVMISPIQSFKGMTINQALKEQQALRNFSTFIVVGGLDSRKLADAKRIEKALKRAHASQGDSDTAVPFYNANVSLQGAELVLARGQNVGDYIRQFIEHKLVGQAERFRWSDRTSPLD